MCNFCNDIKNYDIFKEAKMWDRQDGLYKDNDEIIFCTACDDDYYSRIAIRNIHYCPICGEKLNV